MLKVLKCCLSNLHVRNYAKRTTIDMKYLNVAEKNDAAKTISGLLSRGAARRREGYSVYNKIYEFDAMVKGRSSKMVMTSVSGHLMNMEFLLSYRNWNNVDPQALFEAPIRKAVLEDFQPIKRTLEREIRGCQGLIIWTDCDREGESIGYEIIEVCRAIKPNLPVYRAIFSEITTASVRRALDQLATPDQRQNDAVNVRSELDLRTGAAITRFQTMRLQRLFPEKISNKLISYGSCQIPTLGFVVERYKEVEAFVSEPFWKIKVTHTIDDLTVEFNWARNRLFDKSACEDYFLLCLADPKAKVESVTVKPKNKWRPTPMDTIQMEKLGSRKLKLSAKETMSIAEKLYSKGIISYPRTETNQFSKEIDLRSLVEQQTSHSDWGSFAQRVMEWGPNPRNGNKTDQAHPPIHPTKLMTNLTGNEGRVYELICRHFLACVSKDAVGSETLVHINIAGEKFTATGLCIFERNYLEVYIYEKWNAKQIHHYEEGQIFDPTEITMPEGATTAPPLLTEADLIALMDKHGIGTDATHAEHINTIKERGYIGVVDNNFLVPGVIGMGLYEGYDAMELALAKPLLRAQFEADLKLICAGEKDPQLVLREQIQKYKEAYRQIMDKISAMDEKISLRLNENPNTPSNTEGNLEHNLNHVQELFKCPKCNIAPLALKMKKNQSGHLIGCLNFPDCKNVIWFPEQCKEPTVLDETCQTCGDNVKLLKFKFSTAYYKNVFNAPLWYKTCLRCDAKFRNEFNINADTVKCMGAIVSDTTATATTRPPTVPSNIRNSSTSTTNSRGNSLQNGRGGGGRSTNTTDRNKKSNPKKPKISNTSTTAKTIKNAATTSTNSSGNIRTYFTEATSTSRLRQSETGSVEAIFAEQLNDVALDDFFNSNDSFDNIILAAPANLNDGNNVNNNRTRINSPTVLSADIAAEFANDFDDDWGAAHVAQTATADSSRSLSIRYDIASGNRNSINRIESNIISNFNRPNNDNYSWGSESKNAATSNVNSSRNHEADLTAFPDDDNDIVWGSAAHNNRQTTSTATPVAKRPCREDNEQHMTRNAETPAHSVKCNVCNQLAKELKVKKDGPNKGKIFYACSKSDPCKFFQWADTADNAQPNNSEMNSSSSNTFASSNGGSGWGSNESRSMPTSNRNSISAADTAVAINCNCGIPAKSLTVRKEGPTQGRPFFGCTNRTCNFFQWGDETANDNQASTSTGIRNQSSYAWGSGSNSSQGNLTTLKRNSSTTQQQRDNKKRKCGLCHQEGHNRTKCPRKAEFEY